MKRTGCPDRSCPRELRAKGAGVQYVHRFDHTCRIVSFPVGKRYDFGFADSRAFCFLHGEGAPYPACACMEILHGASPAPVCVSHRLCVIPRRGPGPKQVFFSHTGPRRPRRTLPRPAPESGCPRRPRPLRNGRAFAPNRRGSPGPDHPNPNRFSSPAQVRAGPQDPSAPRPESGCPRRPRPLRNGRAFAPNRRGSPGPDRPGPKQVFSSRTGPRRPRRTLPQPAPESGCPRRPRPLRNGRAFAPNRYGSPGPDRLDPVPPFSLCAAPFVTVFCFPVRFDLPCVPDRRTKIAAEKFPPPSRFFSIYVRTGYKTQWPNHTGRFNISHSAGQFCSLPPHGRGTGRPCMLPIFNLISVIIGCSADKYVK